MVASKNGNLTLVEFIINYCNGTDVNTEDQTFFDNTPLIWASFFGHAKVVQLLLEEDDIDINKGERSGITPLYIASYKQNAEVVRLLLKKKEIEVHKATNSGETPLYWASYKGYTDVVQLLINHYAFDINKEKDDIMCFAATNGLSELASFLLEKENFDVNKENCELLTVFSQAVKTTALYTASNEGKVEVVKLLLQHEDIEINKAGKYGDTALLAASQEGHAGVVQLLLEDEEIEVNRENINGRTALYEASYNGNGNAEIVQLLLQEDDIDVNKEYRSTRSDGENKTVLWIASQKEHTEIVQLLLEHPNTNVISKGFNEQGDIIEIIASLIYKKDTEFPREMSEIFMAAILGKASLISDLLRKNVNGSRMNFYDSYHRTPLFWASTRGHNKVVEILLGQDDVLVNVGRSGNGANPLYQASRYGFNYIVSSLLQHPMIDVNYATLGKKTSLMVASFHGQSEALQRLLSVVDIDVNYATFDGTTALIYAVIAKQLEIIKLLLRCSQTNTNLLDDEYKTALGRAMDNKGRAKKSKDKKIVALFGKRGEMQKQEGHTCCSSKVNRGLHVAVEYSDLVWTKTFLICPGIDINVRNKDGYTPLNLATSKGLLEMVAVFLADQRIDVNKNNTGREENALIIASLKGHVDILKLLLLHNQTLVNQRNLQGQSALSISIEKYQNGERKKFQLVKLLLRCPKTEIIIDSSFGPEIIQSMKYQSSVVEQNPTCCIKVNASLLGAAWINDFRAIKGLIECPGMKSNVNTFDNEGRTPLYTAAMRGHLESLKVLLKSQNINVNIGRRITGGTAFSIASEKSHFGVMAALIVNKKSSVSKGWCSDSWFEPCKVIVNLFSLTTNPMITLPSGEVPIIIG